MENSCYYGSTCETCSINNTALFNEKVNKMNPSYQKTLLLSFFGKQFVCRFTARELENIHIFSLLSPKDARHICYGNTVHDKMTKFGGRFGVFIRRQILYR